MSADLDGDDRRVVLDSRRRFIEDGTKALLT